MNRNELALIMAVFLVGVPIAWGIIASLQSTERAAAKLATAIAESPCDWESRDISEYFGEYTQDVYGEHATAHTLEYEISEHGFTQWDTVELFSHFGLYDGHLIIYRNKDDMFSIDGFDNFPDAIRAAEEVAECER